jgi:hypothetical protein
MRPPRFRFTLGQPGFAIDRARGGPGIIEAMLSGTIAFIILGLAPMVYEWHFYGAFPDNTPGPYLILLAFGVAGLVCGIVVGCLAFGFLFLLGAAVRAHASPPTETVGPIVWRGLDDRGIPHRRAGGRHP